MEKIVIVLILTFVGCLEDRAFVETDSGKIDASLRSDMGKSDIGENDTPEDLGDPPEPTLASVGMSDIKTLSFSWNLVDDVTEYKIVEDRDETNVFTPVVEGIEPGVAEYKHSISLYQNSRSRFRVQSCNRAGCTDSNILEIKALINEGIGYFKPDNTGSSDFFGVVDLSRDGDVMVVGAPQEESSGKGVNSGSGAINATSNAGAAYVFEKNDGKWLQTAYLKASNTDADDFFGGAVSISGDGKFIAIGAVGEASKGAGINGSEQENNDDSEAGAVYVFAKMGSNWSQIAYIKASNSDAGDAFGTQVALSSDGTTLAVSATNEASNSNTINDGLTDNSAIDTGTVYIFSRAGNTWTQQAFLKTQETKPGAKMGFSLAISGDGNVVATNHENALFVFNRDGANWSQKNKISPDTTDSDDKFGAQMSLSLDGKTLVVSASDEDGNGRGSDGDADDNSATDSGAAYVFLENAGNWAQEAYLKASNSKSFDRFGHDVTISDDGNFIAISSIIEGSSGKGVNGPQVDNNNPLSGAVYVFEREGKQWRQISYLKATNTNNEYVFGYRISMSGDGKSLAVGTLDFSASTGIDGDAIDSTKRYAGSVFLY